MVLQPAATSLATATATAIAGPGSETSGRASDTQHENPYQNPCQNPYEDPLTPVRSVLQAMGAQPDQPLSWDGIPDLTVGSAATMTDPAVGWVRATALVSGESLDDLLAAATTRWRAAPHVAATLTWRSYTYWLALPAVVGFAVARRVPLLWPDVVSWQWATGPTGPTARPILAARPFLTARLTSVEVAVLPSDRLASATPATRRAARVRVVPDEAALLDAMRMSLLDSHLNPLERRLSHSRHVGQRTLRGSLASGVARGLARAAEVVSDPTLAVTHQVLDALDLADLVEVTPHDDGRRGLSVRRRTCCLAFTLPEPKICNGCCLR